MGSDPGPEFRIPREAIPHHIGRPSLCRRAFASDVRCGCRLPRTDRASSEWRLALCPDRHAVPAARGRETIMHITEEMSERHVLTLTVANEAGILARIAGMFTARGYHIQSLTVADIPEDHKISRIPIVTNGIQIGRASCRERVCKDV